MFSRILARESIDVPAISAGLKREASSRMRLITTSLRCISIMLVM